MKKSAMTFDQLVASIRQADKELAAQAGRAVNVSLTLRNWMIGLHIAEFELHGADRATYGDKLLSELSSRLGQLEISNCNRRQLYDYLNFYRTYPHIVRSVTAQFKTLLPQGLPQPAGKVPTLSAQLKRHSEGLINRLSYSMFRLLVEIDDSLKRHFYEVEALRGNWSVRELKRQINSLYYERSGLSKDKKKLAKMAQSGVETTETKLNIRDPYVFEFLGLKSREVMSESHLEDQLLDKLQAFLLELGHGFCFEARQKRILIGDDHSFVDLVFYHRILKCHVLVELKFAEFNHENIGQLNTYVSWYKKHMMSAGDNPPVGILLCTRKDHALVEYALAGMDNGLFVSKYQLELPKKEEMQRFIENQLKATGAGEGEA